MSSISGQHNGDATANPAQQEMSSSVEENQRMSGQSGSDQPVSVGTSDVKKVDDALREERKRYRELLARCEELEAKVLRNEPAEPEGVSEGDNYESEEDQQAENLNRSKVSVRERDETSDFEIDDDDIDRIPRVRIPPISKEDVIYIQAIPVFAADKEQDPYSFLSRWRSVCHEVSWRGQNRTQRDQERNKWF
jgi:hypothetical protein